ncbi:MAG TPA: diguanylate cyclase [Clostridiales bacterium]|nr:diguanylate cyclase [Clostridiales bacterium]
MKADNFRNMPDDPPFGIGYLRLFLNKRNKAVDYMFTDINYAFEKLTGWSREDILHKKVSGLTGFAKSEGLFWLSYYEDVARLGRTQETTQWFEALKRYFMITVVPLGKESLMLVVRDADGELGWHGHDEDLDIVFNKTHDAISLVEYSRGGFRYIRNNAVHQALTGFSNINGMTPIQLLGYEVGSKLQEYYEECMRTGRPISYEQNFNFAPGKRVWQTEVTPVFGKDGIRYLLCSSKDVSELKEAQDENEVLAQRLQSMFDYHDAVMLIIEPISGRIVDANPAACEFYGYSKEELQSLLIRDINMLPPDEVEKYRLMTYKKKQRFFIFPHRLKSGDIRIVDVYSCPISDGKNTLLYSIIFDVTDREDYKKELYMEKEILLTTLQSIGDGVVTTDNNGIITGLNSVAENLTGWDKNTAVGRYFTEVFVLQNEETGQSVENPILKVLETGRIVGLANHTELVTRQGRYIPIADSAAPIKTEGGRTFGVVMVFRDVSDEKNHRKQIEFLSYRDHLTGLYNRRYIEEKISVLDKDEHLPISVIMADVNGLKITNDVFGHKAGDTLLKNVAELMQKFCKEDDLIARWGGDEFVIIMTGKPLESAEEVIQKIKDVHIAIEGSSLSLSLSLGCACKHTGENSIQQAIQQAEKYMYQQKLLDGKSYRNAIISTLLATLYEKSNETEEHSKRIETYCHAIGRELQLSSKEMDELSLLALLHDVGKVSIDPNILQKPGSLTAEEWEEMKQHPQIGYRIAQATPELAVVADLILSHHERWDGKGYPRGLKGTEIPLSCRILAVADAYDAMTSDRVYRKAMNNEDAVRELEKNSGTQFEPSIVNFFIYTLQY